MKLKFIDLFAGAGGLSIGFEKAEFENVGFIEFWEKAIETMLRNDPEKRLLKKDIREVNKEDFSGIGNIDILVGGPPCQGFSMAGRRRVGDKRNTLFMNYLNVVDYVKPKFCLLENVRGICTMRNDEGNMVVDRIFKEFEDRGYKIKAKILNSANYQVPQKRERVIFIANNIGVDYEYPSLLPSY